MTFCAPKQGSGGSQVPFDDGVFTVGIIGAGVAGLQQARALQLRGIRCVVYDKAPKVGGLWRENYASYGVQVPGQLYEFPDLPRVKASCCGDLFNQKYPTGAEVQADIEAYADHFGLGALVQCNTEVLAVEERGGGAAGWVFRLATGSQRSSRVFDYCVVCTGMYSTVPFMPALPGAKDFEAAGGRVIHSSRYLDSRLAAGKHVVVVGGAKSAIDVTIDAAAAGGAARSTMVYRHAHWGTPRLLLWFLPFQYVFLSRLGQLLVSLFKGPLPVGAPGWLAPAHALLSCVMRLVFRVVEEIIALQLGQHGDFRPDLDVVADFYGYGHVLSPEFRRMRARGEVSTLRGQVLRLEQGRAVVQAAPKPGCCARGGGYGALAEELSVPCDLLVCATGFGKDYRIFSPAVQAALGAEADGLYLYRHIFPPKVPRLAFCSSEVATISNIATAAIHAEYVARVIAGELQLPPADAMAEEAEATKHWKRSWMPPTSSRASLVLLHQIHYHDRLMQDMGLGWARKRGLFWPLATLLMPYQPRDYAGVLGSGVAAKGGANGGGGPIGIAVRK